MDDEYARRVALAALLVASGAETAEEVDAAAELIGKQPGADSAGALMAQARGALGEVRRLTGTWPRVS